MERFGQVARRALAVAVLVITVGGCSPQGWTVWAFSQEGATPAQVGEALEVAACESGFNPDAVSPSGGHVGVFQLSTRYHRERAARLGFTWEQVAHDARANATVAADLWAEQGWRPWSCRP